MNYFILDTNILVHLIRGSEKAQVLKTELAFENPQNRFFISIVTKAEIRTLSYIFDWGEAKRQEIEQIFTNLTILNINESVVEKYVEIDSYSKCKHPSLERKASHIKMGKNDIWIAATTSVLQATLVTADKDFDHLEGVFIAIKKIL